MARFTLTPGADCAKFIYQSLESGIYANNSAKIGDYIFKLGNYKTVDPAAETQVEVTLWGSDYYLLAVACDAEGNWSSVEISEKLIYDPNGGEEPEPEPEGRSRRSGCRPDFGHGSDRVIRLLSLRPEFVER